jgi:hypothetical protein
MCAVEQTVFCSFLLLHRQLVPPIRRLAFRSDFVLCAALDAFDDGFVFEHLRYSSGTLVSSSPKVR